MPPASGPDDVLARVAAVLGETLGLAPDRTADLARDTRLFGNLPELDSMAVATVLTALEDEFGILIDDEDVTAELFDSVGALADHVAAELARQHRGQRARA
ncbi:MAG: acyl carrier protein [Thermaurantiacus tibetensis]|uniref:acyl carrier protein n=1 Tax=Thermaurantiacus tibetensis TaxID=2759035 RepID=UPI0018909F26|nr:acyl carrier protein [Thermaurantiacus tibetensis]